jgi:hypothetical protein
MDLDMMMDLTHVPCGADGWGRLAVVIDCHDREVIGWGFALRGRAQEAERAREHGGDDGASDASGRVAPRAELRRPNGLTTGRHYTSLLSFSSNREHTKIVHYFYPWRHGCRAKPLPVRAFIANDEDLL